MSSSRVRVQIDTDAIMKGKMGSRFAQAQKFLDSEVLRCSAPYVPMRTGNLMNSGVRGTKIGSGEVIYNAPYARACYYGFSRNFSKVKHPQACAQWFEVAKAVHLNDWLNGVGQVLQGGGGIP